MAPIVAMAAVSMGISYTFPMFALLLERAGFSGTVIGLNATAAAVTMVLAAPILPRLAARIGVARLMIWSAAITACALLMVPLFPNIWWWSLLRLTMGFAVTSLFFGAEYWLVEIAPAQSRGRIVAVYSIILSASYAIGPKLLGWVGLEGWVTVAVPASVLLAAILPVWLGRRTAPIGRVEDAASPRQTLGFFRSDPLILWGVVLFGMIEFGAMGLLSVWGVRIGLEESAALWLLSLLAVGSALFQLPVGLAADRYDRRRLLALAGFISILAPLGMIWLSASYASLVVLSLVWGGMAVALYTLALTELGARYQGSELAAGNAAVVLAYGLGALLAPASFGAAMDAIPPDGVLWLAGIAALAYVVLALVRLGATPRKTLDMGSETRR